MVARPSVGLVEPRGHQRGVDLRPDRDAGPACGGLAWGLRLKGSDAVARSLFGDGATSEGAFHEGANIAAVIEGAARPRSATTTSGRSRRRSGADRRRPPRRQGDRLRDARVRVDGHDVLAVYEAMREGVERAREGGGPTFVEAVTYRAAPHATADDPSLYIDAERVEEERERDCVALYEEYLRGLGLLDDERDGRRPRGGACGDARGDRGRRGRGRRPTPSSLFAHAYVAPPPDARPRSRRAPAGARAMSATALATRELLLVEAVNDALHVELARDESVMVLGEDVGRLGGVFRATAGLRDRFGPDRCVDTPLSEAGILGAAVGLCMAGWRPVVEMQYDAFSYPPRPADHPRRPLPLAHRRAHGLPARRPHAVRRRRPRAGAPRRLARDVLRPHAGREGGRPGDARRREGPPRRGDPRPGPGRRARAEARLPHGPRRGPEGEHVVELGRARLARSGTDVTLVAWGAMVAVCERAADALAREASVEVLDLRTLKPLDEEGVLASVRRTGRCVVVQEAPRTCGFASEVAALLAEQAILDLRGPVAARDRLRRAVPLLAARGLVHALRRARGGRRPPRARLLSASGSSISADDASPARTPPAGRGFDGVLGTTASTEWKHVSSSGSNVVRR